MQLFGLQLGAAELLWIGVGAQWVLSAVAHALPPPDDKSGKGYRFLSNLIQMLAANLYLIKAGQPPPQPPDQPKIISIDRNAA